MAEAALREKCGVKLRIEVIRTRGDDLGVNEGRKGVFTAELERALLERRIDVAVHSAKDLPSQMNGGLVIAAVLPRGPVEDLLITKRRALCSFGTIATGSVRRQRQARWLNKPPQKIVSLRGNVPTRLRKFAGSDWDAIVLARAGVERLGFSAPQFEFEGQTFFAEILPGAKFVPAGGQGVIALQTRVDDAPVFAAADDRETHLCLRAEREFLRLLEGDCNLPVGAYARFIGDEMELRAQVFGEGEEARMASAAGNDPEKLGKEVFEKIEQAFEHEHEHEHE